MRLTAFFLCMVCLFGLFPASAFALEPGQAASSWTGSQYAASDGGTYDHPTPWYSMTYHADGFKRRDPFRVLRGERRRFQ